MIRQTGNRSRAVDLHLKFEAFVTERYPMAVAVASDAFAVAARDMSDTSNFITQLRRLLEPELRKRLRGALPPVATETTPALLGGTRHLSAAQFVQDQRDATALVASQDGGFTIFQWSEGDQVVHAYRVDVLLL